MDKTRWQQIEELYFEALDFPSARRLEFLQQKCTDNTELIGEVLALLESSDESDDFLAESEYQLALEILNNPQNSLRTGEDFGKYKIIKFLGSGGMGEVYLANDSSLRRKVALKLIPPEIAVNPERIKRFQIEARAASRIIHRNVAQIYETGEIRGIYYMTMEFVDGITLRKHLRTADISPQNTLLIARQTASALAAAHQVGVVHRDLKPENIMISSQGEIKVLDFSLAKLMRRTTVQDGAVTENDSNFLTHSFKTEPGFLMGTAAYMSPEQARGLEVDARTDIWSFGVLLYEIIKGAQPFSGDTPMDTIVAILTGNIEPLPRSTDETLNKLAYVVHRSVQKDPAKRYQTASDLIVDLDMEGSEEMIVFPEGFNSNDQIQITSENAERETEDEEIAVFKKNVRTPATHSETEEKRSFLSGFTSRTVFVLALILISTVFGGLWYANRSGETRRDNEVSGIQNIKSIAVLPFKTINIETEENLEIGMADALINRLGSMRKFTIRPTAAVKKFARRDADPIAAGQELKVDAVLDSIIQKEGERLMVRVQMIDVKSGDLLWTNNFNENISEIFKMQESISAKIAQSLSSTLPAKNSSGNAYQENTEAYRAYLRGKFHADREIDEEMVKAARYYRQAIEIDPDYAPAYVGLADYYVENYGEAKMMTYGERVEKARVLILKALEIDESLAAAHVSLASLLMHHDWDWAEAEKEYQRAIELNPNLARAHHSYAYYLVFVGRFDEALASIHKAQEIDPVSTRIARDIGSINILARRYDEAKAAFESAYDMDREPLSIHMNLGSVFQFQKRYDKAMAEYKKAIIANPDYLDGYASLAQVQGLIGEREKALKTLSQMQQRAKGRNIWTYYMVRIYTGIGDKNKAFEWLEKGMQDRSIGIRLKVDPNFDELRDDPRFADFIRRVRFPKLM